MLGGAGGAYSTLFESNQTYSTCYKLLIDLIKKYDFIKGIDLDIEETVSLNNVKRLINNLNNDLNKEFIITMAPVSNALLFDYPGLGGFKYKDLLKSDEGKRINWFNCQFYFQYDFDTYNKVIQNGYDSDKIVFGMISSNFINDFDKALDEIKKIKIKYNNFGGVYVWEYFNCPPEPKNPFKWSEFIYSILNK